MNRLLSALLVAAVASMAIAEESLPPGAKIVRLEAVPAAVNFKSPYEYRQLLITAVLDSGDRLDATRLAKLDVPAAIKLSPTGLIRPAADGKGELKVSIAGQSIAVPVNVAGQTEKYEVSFVRDVMPTLSKLGCNAGTCHGAADGKNGFKLSLRGYDPLFDFRALTDDLEGRRFNRAAPERSLMLMKPGGAVPHTGGMLMQPGDPAYDLLKTWISEGVVFDPNTARVAKIEVGPKGAILPMPGMKQQVTVFATYGDGTTRDVTAEAFVDSSNTDVATVDKTGLVTAARRGESTIQARYEGSYDASTMIVMGDRSGFQWKDVPANNKIDELVYEKLKKMRILPSELCRDDEFVRRVYLDLTGLPPTPEQMKAFVADPRPTRVKRDELIDKLVGCPEFIEQWTNKWADLLEVNRKFLGETGAAGLRKWIRTAIEKNMPYDEFARTILTANGSNVANPPASYFKILREPDIAMENTTQLFLAVRFNCNKCHDHPFERWTQNQYYQLASFFAQVSRHEDPMYKGRKIGGSAVEGAVSEVEVIADSNSGEVKQIRTGEIAKPTFPFTHKGMPEAKGPRRQQLAQWITSKDNPYFAKSYMNRIWAYLMGVGLIEPIDDIRAGNPASNPQLLDYLTEEFVANKFDVRSMMKMICKSRVYQHSIETNKWNEGDESNYSHAVARRLPAEVLFDAIHYAVGAQAHIPGMPAGSRAAQMIDSSVPIPGGFLELFGKPPRESACECERAGGVMLGPVLNMVNGPVVGEALKDPSNRLAKLIAAEADDNKVVEEIYIAILCRKPTAAELANGVTALRSAQKDFDRLLAIHNERSTALAAYEAQIPARQVAWEKQFSAPTAWETLKIESVKSAGGSDLKILPDGSILASGKNPFPEVYTVTATTKMTGITAIRLEALTDNSLPNKGPGRSPSNGNFVLNQFKLEAMKTAAKPVEPAKTTQAPKADATKPVDASKPKPVVLKDATADFSQEAYSIKGAIDNKPETGWAISPQVGLPHVAMFKFAAPADFPEGTTYTVTLDQRYPGKDHNLGKFRLSVTKSKAPALKDPLSPALLSVIATPLDKRTPEQKAMVTNYFRGQDAELTRLQAAVAENPKPASSRLLGAQDLAWALINSPAFLFNH